MSDNTPDTTNITAVFTYATNILTKNDAIGIEAELTAVTIPAILARYSCLVLFTTNTFKCEFINAIV